MPYYEVTVTVSKPVCVKADSEGDAKDKALDELSGDWNRSEAEIEDEYDESDPTQAKFIKEYKESGEYYEA
jgi:hypothetical protein